MAELATIARPYAEALFESAQASSGGLGAVQAWLGPLAAIGGDDQLLAWAQDPKVKPEQVSALIASLWGEPLPAQASNFLSTVVANGRLAALPEVLRQFTEKAAALGGVREALIQSAFAMNESELSALMPALEKRFGHALKAKLQVVPELIGGIRVIVGDEVLDTSVKARLAQMQAVLAA